MSASATLKAPVTVRVTIPNVLTAYVTLEHEDDGSEELLYVEGATVFGPREKKPPHSQSDFEVFQKLSQHIAGMLRGQPRVPFQSIVHLFNSYESLLTSVCSLCKRVISEEGHLPPVVRVWTEGERQGEEARWITRHIACT